MVENFTPFENPTEKIDINSAGREELARIPGIDFDSADKIIDWRTTHGGFSRIEDLEQAVGIPGFGIAGVRKYITVGKA